MSNLEQTKDDNLKTKALLVEFSEGVLSEKKNLHYISLKIGSGPNSSAVNVYPNHIRCFITSTELRKKLEENGFVLVRATEDKPRNENWFHLHGVSLSDIQAHQGLFEGIVRESVKTVRDRQNMKKRTKNA